MPCWWSSCHIQCSQRPATVTVARSFPPALDGPLSLLTKHFLGPVHVAWVVTAAAAVMDCYSCLRSELGSLRRGTSWAWW